MINVTPSNIKCELYDTTHVNKLQAIFSR